MIFETLIQLFEHYLSYPIDDSTSEQMTTQRIILLQKDFNKQLQTLLFKRYNLILTNKDLENFTYVKDLNQDEMKKVFQILNLVYPEPLANYAPGFEFNHLLIEVLKLSYPQLKPLSYPLIPNEAIVWDYKRIPDDNTHQTLSLPKLNLQFLSLQDYLERNYWLYKLETAFDLRKDFEDTIMRMSPNEKNEFQGWARMATEVTKFRIHEVQEPCIGQRHPRRVYAEVQYSVEKMSQNVKREWETL